MTGAELVTVVIPAYNAAATIDETIRSVRSQTYARLEILIIDDGSSDATPVIVQSHIAADPRIRLLRQANGGVAVARNRGWKEAAGELIAFIDADDLWAADKIERQVAALKKAGAGVALVYTWYAMINQASFVIKNYYPMATGNVLEDLFAGNFVGNGSSVLITKAALSALGGYDSTLRERRAQGCEDFLLYFRIAERYQFLLVPEQLTGYRQTSTNMSSDFMQMKRSWRLVAAEMCSRHPKHGRTIAQGMTFFVVWLLTRALQSRQTTQAARLALTLLLRRPDLAGRVLLLASTHGLLRSARRNLFGSQTELRSSIPEASRFEIGDPDVAL